MIYSCSMFFNEFKLLDLKIAEQSNHVDQIIIVESERTHSNLEKDVILYNNKKYNHPKLKKVLVKADEFNSNSGHNEGHQRNVSIRGIDIKDDDIIISCDLDEIIPSKDFPQVVDKIKDLEYVRFGMDLYYYKINMRLGSWKSPIGVTGKFLKDSGKTLTQLRHARKGKLINTQGKHFSYLTSAKGIEEKLKSFVHHKLGRNITLKDITERIKKGEDLFKRGDRKATIVPIDESYPDYILNNLDEWKEWIA